MKKIFLLTFMFFSLNIFSQDLKIETLSEKDSLKVMKVSLTPEDLALTDTKLPHDIVLKIFFNKHGSILGEMKDYKPKANEIAFFYARNYEAKKLEMFFMFGKSLRETYLKKEYPQMIKMVEILEHKVFTIASFSGMKAYSALEDYE